MVTRNGTEGDLPRLIPLLKSFFTTHNKFQKEEAEVLEYLKRRLVRSELHVCDNGEITACLFLVQRDQNIEGTHKTWRLKHFAFADENAATELLGAAERRIKELSETAKIEQSIAESEPGLDFYRNHGFKQEGALESHFRLDETCYLLGKVISR